VVATRRATPADRLAYSVTAVDHQVLTAQGVDDASTLSFIVPSMTVTNLGMGRDKILLRGVSDGPLTGQTQSMVATYLDDVRLTFNAPDPDLRLTDIEQVEILRGPQGALYGAGSLGGVVQIISTPPDRRRFSAWAAASVGTTSGGAASSALDGTVNLPLLKGRGAARMVLYREIQGGYISDPPLQLQNVNRTQRQGLRATGVFDLSGRWTISLGGTSQRINSADTQYTDASETPYTRDNLVREPHDNDFDEIHLGVRGDLGWGEAKISVAEIRHNLDSRYDAATNPPLIIPRGPAAFDETDQISSFVTEATVVSLPSRPVQGLLGVFYAHTGETHGTMLSVLGPPTIIEDQSSRQDHLDEAALFGEASLPLTRQIRLSAGGRLFSFSDTVASATSAVGYTMPPAFSGQANQVGFAPKLVLSVAPAPGVIAYVQAAEGYRGRGLNTADTPAESFAPPGGMEPLRTYSDDELWSLEAGGEAAILDNRLHVRAAAFETFWNGVQSDQLLPSGLPYTANIGEGRNIGFELEADVRVGALRLHGSFLADHPELARANPGFAALADCSLGAAPAITANGEARYAWSLWGEARLELDGRVAYVGASRLTLNTATTRTMGQYVTARVAASLVGRGWRLTVALDNPGDTQGDTFAYGNPFTLSTTKQVTRLRPRTASATLRVAY
jgi:outer membrane receptor protein involved in Fe transport